MISANANYNKNSDSIEVNFYKHDINNVILPITSGEISLLQSNLPISSIEIDSKISQVTFYHPKSLYNLSVSLLIDSETLIVDVYDNPQLESPVDFKQGVSPDTLTYLPTSTEIEATQEVDNFIILDIDFSTPELDLEYSGGNRVIFDGETFLVQPQNKIIALRPIEVSVRNLLSNGQDQVDLVNTFKFTHVNHTGNFYLINKYGYPSLLFRSLGGITGANTAPSKLTLELAQNCLLGQTFQAYLGFDKDITPKTFRIVCEALDNSNNIVETTSETYDIKDFIKNLSLVSLTPNYNSLATKLNFKLEVDQVYSGDTFAIDIILPQVTSLRQPTTYTENTRYADIYSRDVVLNYTHSTFEMNLKVSENSDCVLFDCGTVKAYYESGVLLFDVNATEISFTVSLKDHENYSFVFDTQENQMIILVDDVPVATGINFAINSNSKLYLGCDSLGENQINGVINRFKILKGY